jgi:hypothetical protein
MAFPVAFPAAFEVAFQATESGGDPGGGPATCNVKFVVRNQLGPVEDAEVTIELVGYSSTIDDAIIQWTPLKGLTDSNGEYSVDLIRSSEFTRGGKYSISVRAPTGERIHYRTVSVPDEVEVNAEDLPTAVR